jgi:hypothetical protein
MLEKLDVESVPVRLPCSSTQDSLFPKYEIILSRVRKTGCSPRKWMSGQAAALTATQDRTPLTATLPLREPTLPSVRRPPSPLDVYLSWMSLHFPADEPSDILIRCFVQPPHC